jgi:hypothetical protein
MANSFLHSALLPLTFDASPHHPTLRIHFRLGISINYYSSVLQYLLRISSIKQSSTTMALKSVPFQEVKIRIKRSTPVPSAATVARTTDEAFN